MSLAEDSPVHSSSSDDFAAILEAELDAASNSSGDSVEGAEEEESGAEDNDDISDFDLDHERVKRQKVELNTGIVNPQSSSSQGATSENIVSSSEEEICTHPGFFAGMCMKCGLRADDDSGVALKYIDKNLRLANDEMTRLRDKDFKDLLFNRKKLYLVLDLDHTLLNSSRLTDITEEEAYLNNQRDSLPDLLDPGNKYFHSRIIAQGDCTQKFQKGLDIVLGRESTVLILDDTEAVWKENKENLILMDRYHFFASSCKNFGFSHKSLSLLKTDESETEGALATVLKVLQQAHSLFFDKECKDNLEDRDVRQVLKTVRKEVLKDCKIVFTHVFPVNFTAEHHHLWRMAEQLGATCSTEVDHSVTHVVSGDAGTDKSRWAVRENKFVVNPGWIEASNILWRKQPEEKFPVSPARCKQ
ncbi:RNA polymerase II C-terminal domain phosphatase-like 4 isoform X3 [Salvia hispanica]|uniref:RNA polymerase II C-terminal domain phosphatase-like 4 isoform X3 n=1 Tax=Salvia hispanica TaxID=49212 RepID=UPI0020099866|nr:RNA polymerase II C-terminal domain phosphatase-like 4 isoform X3 [Salvia hispanica]